MAPKRKAAADKQKKGKEKAAGQSKPRPAPTRRSPRLAAGASSDASPSLSLPKQRKKPAAAKVKQPPAKKAKKTKEEAASHEDDASSPAESEVDENDDEDDDEDEVSPVKKTIIIEHCKQCKSFKETAEVVQAGLDLISGFTVSINPSKPRKGCFEVRDEDGHIFVSLLDMPRPFEKMQQLDCEAVVKDIISHTHGHSKQ